MRVFKLTTADPALFEASWEGKLVQVPGNLHTYPGDIVVLNQYSSQREVQGHIQSARNDQGVLVPVLAPVLRWNLRKALP
jgi:hypothetical protein